jgi:hypothetical protein
MWMNPLHGKMRPRGFVVDYQEQGRSGCKSNELAVTFATGAVEAEYAVDEPGADQLDDLLDREAVCLHHCFGAAVRAPGQQYERTAATGLAGRLVTPCPSCGRVSRSRQEAVPTVPPQASARRSSGRSTSLPLPAGHASPLRRGRSMKEPEREMGYGHRAWRGFLSRRPERVGRFIVSISTPGSARR